MPVQDITRILQSYKQDGGALLTNRYGEQARSIAADMAALLETRLLGDTPYASLWEEFRSDPKSAAPELTGALEALIEADPGLTRRLDDMLERYRRVTMPATAAADTLSETEEPDIEIDEQLDHVDVEGDIAESLAVTGDSHHRSGEFERGAYLYGDTMSGQEAIGYTVKPPEQE